MGTTPSVLKDHGSVFRQVANPRLKHRLLLAVFHAVVDALAVLALLGAFSVVALPTGFPSDLLLGSHGVRCDLTESYRFSQQSPGENSRAELPRL